MSWGCNPFLLAQGFMRVADVHAIALALLGAAVKLGLLQPYSRIEFMTVVPNLEVNIFSIRRATTFA
jgi:hypothetical protein